MTHGSLFSGIGGFDLASEWMGWDNVFHCEWNDFGQKVLKYYWPQAKSYEDITKTDFTIHRGRIDILTGGFPCQPYSAAGKRKGKEDDRHLWPEMLRAIREIRPRWVVGENVLGLVNWSGGLVFDEVQADLEAAGYEVWAYVLPACAKNAPHRRDRVWFVAHADCCRNNTTEGSENCIREQSDKKQSGDRGSVQINGFSNERVTPDTSSIGFCRQEQIGELDGIRFGKYHKRENGDNWQNFPTQPPICDGNDGISARLDGITFPKWRNESIKAGGNAIVPQVVLQIFLAIQKYNSI